MPDRYTLRRIGFADIPDSRNTTSDPEIARGSKLIVEDIRDRGDTALEEWSMKLDGRERANLLFDRDDFAKALSLLPGSQRGALERAAERVRSFADAQRASFLPVSVQTPLGMAGVDILPLENAGCYAPGGRFPLPSSVIMTSLTARAAGVRNVYLACPKPVQVILAAAALCDVDLLLAAGGAQAVAALAYGYRSIPPCDIVCGPGNSWTTEAKRLVSGTIRIDSLAGPSELLVVADGSAAARVVALDMIAQAEHDSDARCALLATDESVVREVEAALDAALGDMPRPSCARESLDAAWAFAHPDIATLADASNRFAPEHLELLLADADMKKNLFVNCGALFIGSGAAEVFGDYGAGPNHVLPTSGGCKSRGGLSVVDFLRFRTYIDGSGKNEDHDSFRRIIEDTALLARLEGLEGHARAAEIRMEAHSKPTGAY